jgi:hypothetical protein
MLTVRILHTDEVLYPHVSLNVLPTHVQVAAVIKRCEAQSAAGKGRCSELERYMTNCIKVGRGPDRSANGVRGTRCT